jgi:uncharacterized protein
MSDIQELVQKACRLISDAGGSIVGRTRIQKAAYLLEEAGLGEGFRFYYKHYGPYSDDLSVALKYGGDLDLIKEEEKIANWGGSYSVFRVPNAAEASSDARAKFLTLAKEADPVELELVATAIFLAKEGSSEPWREAKKRKPEKATEGRLLRSKQLYMEFKQLDRKKSLPAIG